MSNSSSSRNSLLTIITRANANPVIYLGFCDARSGREIRDVLELVPATTPDKRQQTVFVYQQWYELGRRIAASYPSETWPAGTTCPRWLREAAKHTRNLGAKQFDQRHPDAEITVPPHMLPSLRPRGQSRKRKQWQPPAPPAFNVTSYLADLGL